MHPNKVLPTRQRSMSREDGRISSKTVEPDRSAMERYRIALEKRIERMEKMFIDTSASESAMADQEEPEVFQHFMDENEAEWDLYVSKAGGDDKVAEQWHAKVLNGEPKYSHTVKGSIFLKHVRRYVQSHSKSHENWHSISVYCPSNLQYGIIKRILAKSFGKSEESEDEDENSTKKKKVYNADFTHVKSKILLMGLIDEKDPDTYKLSNLEKCLKRLDDSEVAVLNKGLKLLNDEGYKFVGDGWEESYLKIVDLFAQTDDPLYDPSYKIARRIKNFKEVCRRMALSENQQDNIVNRYSTTHPSQECLTSHFQRMGELEEAKQANERAEMKPVPGSGYTKTKERKVHYVELDPVQEGEVVHYAKSKGKNYFQASSGGKGGEQEKKCRWCSGLHILKDCRSFDIACHHARAQNLPIPVPSDTALPWNTTSPATKSPGGKHNSGKKGNGKKGNKTRRYVYSLDEFGNEIYEYEELVGPSPAVNPVLENHDTPGESKNDGEKWEYNQDDLQVMNVNIEAEISELEGGMSKVSALPVMTMHAEADRKHDRDTPAVYEKALGDSGYSSHMFGSQTTASLIETVYSDHGIPTARQSCWIPCMTASGKSHCKELLILPVVLGLLLTMTIFLVSPYEHAPFLIGEKLLRKLHVTQEHSPDGSKLFSAKDPMRKEFHSHGSGVYVDIIGETVRSSAKVSKFAEVELQKIKAKSKRPTTTLTPEQANELPKQNATQNTNSNLAMDDEQVPLPNEMKNSSEWTFAIQPPEVLREVYNGHYEGCITIDRLGDWQYIGDSASHPEKCIKNRNAAAMKHNSQVPLHHMEWVKIQSLTGFDQELRERINHSFEDDRLQVWARRVPQAEREVGLWKKIHRVESFERDTLTGLPCTNRTQWVDQVAVVKKGVEPQTWIDAAWNNIKVLSTKVKTSLLKKNLKDRGWVSSIPLLKIQTARDDKEKAKLLLEDVDDVMTYEQFCSQEGVYALAEGINTTSSITSDKKGSPEEEKLKEEVRRLVLRLAYGLGYPPAGFIVDEAIKILGLKSEHAKDRFRKLVKEMINNQAYGLPYSRLPGSKVGSVFGIDARRTVLIDTTYVKDSKGRNRALLVAVSAGTRFTWVKLLGVRVNADNERDKDEILPVSPSQQEVADFITEIYGHGCRATQLILDKGREFRNRLVLGRAAAHGCVVRYGAKGSVGQTSMVERAHLTLKTLSDRVSKSVFWKALYDRSPEGYWLHINGCRNAARMGVLRGLSPYEAEKLTPPPVMFKAPEECSGFDRESVLSDWSNYILLSQERDNMVRDSGFLMKMRKISERVHKSMSKGIVFSPGSAVEVKDKKGNWLPFVVIGSRTTGTGRFYDVRTPLGTRVSDVQEKHCRPSLELMDVLDIPDAVLIKNWMNMSDQEIWEQEELEENRDAIGDDAFTLSPSEIPTTPWPKCTKCGKERRVAKPEELPKKWTCKDLQGYCSTPSDKLCLQLGYGVRPRVMQELVHRVPPKDDKKKGKNESSSSSGKINGPEAGGEEPNNSDEEYSDSDVASDNEDANNIERGSATPATRQGNEPSADTFVDEILQEGDDYKISAVGLIGTKPYLRKFYDVYQVKPDEGQVEGSNRQVVKVQKVEVPHTGTTSAVTKQEAERRKITGKEFERVYVIEKKKAADAFSVRLDMKETYGLYKLLNKANKTLYHESSPEQEWDIVTQLASKPLEVGRVRIKVSGTKVRLTQDELKSCEPIVVNPRTGARRPEIEFNGGEGFLQMSKEEICIIYSKKRTQGAAPTPPTNKLGDNVEDEVRCDLSGLPEPLQEKAIREGKLANVDMDILTQCGYSKYVIRAMKKELQGLLKLQKTGVPVGRIVSGDREKETAQLGNATLRSKFLIDIKAVKKVDGKYTIEIKARLVPGGYLMKWEDGYDSATVSSDITRVILSKASTMANPIIVTGDIGRAFNLSNPLSPEKRNCVRYPKNIEEGVLDKDESLQGDNSWGKDEFLEILIPLYGMRDASSAFFRSLEEHLQKGGFQNTEMAPALYVSQNRKVYLISHVDDVMVLSDCAREIAKTMQYIDVRFPVKGWNFLQESSAEFCGKVLSMEKNSQGVWVIRMRMDSKARGLELISFPDDAKDEDKLSPELLKQWQSAYGSIIWLAQYRLDLSYLSKWCVPHSNIKEAKIINEVIKYIQSSMSEVASYECSISNPKLLVHVDASLQLGESVGEDGEVQTGKPIAGWTMGIISQDTDVVKTRDFAWSIITFGTSRIPRRVFSSYAAEIEALMFCLHRIDYVLVLLGMVFAHQVGVEIGSDSMSAIRRVNSRSGIKPRDSENVKALLYIKDRFRANEFAMHYLSETDNLSDTCTKASKGGKKNMLKRIQTTGRFTKDFYKDDTINAAGAKRILYDSESVGDGNSLYSWSESRDGPNWDREISKPSGNPE